jgi:hypothetical protein
MPTQDYRLGWAEGISTVQDKIGEAFKQIDRTAAIIRERRDEFTAIPNDRPIIGLAVTLEPFHMAQGYPVRQDLPTTSTPTLICSADELELLVIADNPSTTDIILKAVRDPAFEGWALKTITGQRNPLRNPILDASWKTFAHAFRQEAPRWLPRPARRQPLDEASAHAESRPSPGERGPKPGALPPVMGAPRWAQRVSAPG